MPYLYSFRTYQPLLWAGLLAGTTLRATAQTSPDTTRLSYGEEAAPPSTTAPLRVQPEERHLWKLGLNNFTLGARTLGPDTYYTRYGVHLAYERKLGRPAWTVLGEVSPALMHYRSEAGGTLRRGLEVRTQLAGRYYYNLDRRLRLGRNIGNFSANYVSVALGAGLGRQAHATPFYYLAPKGQWARVDAAVLYGLQRRLGRYGFVDVNVGLSSLLDRNRPMLGGNGSLRVGLALGAWPPTPYVAGSVSKPVPKLEEQTLRPRAYVGAQLGSYVYRLHYSTRDPYPPSALSWFFQRSGHGVYTREVKTPSYYAGYYLRPRLAVQLGVQRQSGEYGSSSAITDERELAVPVLLRYSLTRSFLQRVQFDAVGGLVPVWSSVHYQEQPTGYSFRRATFGMHASLGLNAGYGFGRRRRVQATAEWVVNKDLRTNFRGAEAVQGGGSIGLRYRFGYR